MKGYKQPAISKNYRASNGQLLIEVLISTLVLLIITSGIVASVIVGVRNAAYARQRTLATYYAQREMELAKQNIKENWCFPGTGSKGPPCNKAGDFTQYPVVSPGSFDGISVVLFANCFIDGVHLSDPNLCSPPVVGLRAIASWNRAGANTASQVVLSTIIVKDNL